MFVRCYFPAWQNNIQRLPAKNYPTNPQTVGEQLLKRRLDLHLLQKNVAKIIGITEESIMHWETEKYPPQLQFYPGIIKFLGFNPFKAEGKTLAVRIKNYRLENGLSHKKLGKILGMDGSTISRWETGVFMPDSETQSKLEELFSK